MNNLPSTIKVSKESILVDTFGGFKKDVPYGSPSKLWGDVEHDREILRDGLAKGGGATLKGICQSGHLGQEGLQAHKGR